VGLEDADEVEDVGGGLGGWGAVVVGDEDVHALDRNLICRNSMISGLVGETIRRNESGESAWPAYLLQLSTHKLRRSMYKAINHLRRE
jgi:hypothetical protein